MAEERIAPPRQIPWWTRRQLRRKRERGERLTAEDAFVFSTLRRGDVAIDCGANVGEVTARMAARGAEVHAFEPDPNAFERLAARFAAVANVRCHKQAVSDHDGTMTLYYREEQEQDPVKFSVGSTLHRGKTDINPELNTEVEVVRLRDFMRRFARVRMLKLDIEGAECDVLADLLEDGALARVDVTLVETHEEWIPATIEPMREIRRCVEREGLPHVYFNWI